MLFPSFLFLKYSHYSAKHKTDGGKLNDSESSRAKLPLLLPTPQRLKMTGGEMDISSTPISIAGASWNQVGKLLPLDLQAIPALSLQDATIIIRKEALKSLGDEA
jgi:hypothetical protein